MSEQRPHDDLSDPDSTIKRALAAPPRRGWAKAAQQMAARGDDALIDPPTASRFDADEWKW